MSKVSKVIYGDTTVIDITDSTVNANNLLSGNKAYGADGEPVFGALSVGSTINVTTSESELFGETLTLSDGTITLTTAFDNSGEATFTSVLLIGILTLTCGEITNTISVPSYDTYNVEFTTVPNGKVVTPTDDIQTWLACAGIKDKSYTTLTEVLADRETFETLIADSNACDYMARSTSWAVAEGQVPTMTSNTTPSGKVTYSQETTYTSYPIWKAFDNDDSTYGAFEQTQYTSNYIGYVFTSSKRISRAVIKIESTQVSRISRLKIVCASQEGGTWIDASDWIAPSADNTVVINNDLNYPYWAMYWDRANTNPFGIYTIQFYEADITHNQDAMALIGKYDYCSNALLSNATWASAIGNSEYWDSVISPLVPKLTADSASVITNLQVKATGYEKWHAFDGNTGGNFFYFQYTPSRSDGWVGYDFGTPVRVCKASMYNVSNTASIKNCKYQYSDDGSTWTDATELITNAVTGTWTDAQISSDSGAHRYWCAGNLINNGDGGGAYIPELQFYGRASKEVLVPLVPTMTSDTTPSGVASADSIYMAGYEAYRAFDNASSTNDAWMSGSVASSYNFPHWIQYQFPTAQVVGGLHFKNYSTGSSGVKTFKVQGSNDGTTWTDLYSGTGTNAGGGTLQEFYFDNTTAYLYYRLYITEGYSAIQCGICYLQFLRTQSLTNIIHSSANDTIYYYENGSPIIIATTNSSGIGICDFSLLDNKIYTLYSTVAKDPSNLSNPYSKQVRITKSYYGGTTELYLMPDAVKTLYWWGYQSSELSTMYAENWTWGSYSKANTAVFQTHYVDITTSSSTFAGIVSKNTIPSGKKAKCIAQGVTTVSDAYISFCGTTNKVMANYDFAYSGFTTAISYNEQTSTANDYISLACAIGRHGKAYALWYE